MHEVSIYRVRGFKRSSLRGTSFENQTVELPPFVCFNITHRGPSPKCIPILSTIRVAQQSQLSSLSILKLSQQPNQLRLPIRISKRFVDESSKFSSQRCSKRHCNDSSNVLETAPGTAPEIALEIAPGTAPETAPRTAPEIASELALQFSSNVLANALIIDQETFQQ